ncbi:TOTE conflict system archaeo-eukaryotic primase domain-containing protein [Herbaspirillum autotrophicum]|uniref:TOTE conflict system archaeo-eukaryotic primase domain-containing protein n=1 Tax=Herbaspirillum autotrophicum TaxID=180195 RepID=UPI00067B836A|nr:DEAD/DEAH box helicase [Herbaspirillum autotrophicum]
MSKVDAELFRLRAENDMLRALISKHGIAIPQLNTVYATANTPSTVASILSPEAKIKLFRRLFHGRDDVYPVRWESKKTGKPGYSPVCANEWRNGVCQKPVIKCSECTKSLFAPVTNEVISSHLKGKITAGVYPLLADDRCYFLAIDFDDADWREDAKAVLQTCIENDLPAALEISRSGEGAHLWLFFANPTPARDARRLGTALISATCARTRQLKLESYDRLFPNQDTMPKGGFGNLIALPLQKHPRDLGRSVFVDANLQPLPDQWIFLESIKPLPQVHIEAILNKLVGDRHPLDIAYAEVPDENADTPWIAPAKPNIQLTGVMPRAVIATIAGQIFIEKAGLPQTLMNRLVRLAAFQNPDFYKAQAMRMSAWDKPRVIGRAENHPKHMALPRGCMNDVRSLLTANKIDLRLDDARSKGCVLNASFQGVLRPDQQEALEAVLPHDFGMLVAPTAFGKTVTAAAIIARRKVSTLVIVHRADLMRQWQERLGTFVVLDEQKIGLIGAGKKKATGLLDIAVIQSLARREDLPELFGRYGQIIVDEAHHLSAQTFEGVLKQANSHYVLGLSATPIRSNGHHPIMFMQCGPVRHVAQRPAHVPEQLTVRVHHLPTPTIPPHASIQEVIRLLAEDRDRNARIVADAISALNDGRKVLLLTKRTEHLDLLNAYFTNVDYPCFMLHGRMKAKERQLVIKALAELPPDAPHILLASAQLVGEGFDHAPLDTLILTLPISWAGTLQQYAGRLHRDHADKTDILIHDYAELDHPQLSRMWEKRQRGYKAMGYKVEVDQQQLSFGRA